MESTMTTAKKADFEKITTDAAAQGKDHFDAYSKAANLWAKGSEEWIKTYVALTQESAEKTAAGFKAMLACKTLNELTEAQSKLAQSSVEGMIANATKLSELGTKVATESLEPINAQYAKAMKKAAA